MSQEIFELIRELIPEMLEEPDPELFQVGIQILIEAIPQDPELRAVAISTILGYLNNLPDEVRVLDTKTFGIICRKDQKNPADLMLFFRNFEKMRVADWMSLYAQAFYQKPIMDHITKIKTGRIILPEDGMRLFEVEKFPNLRELHLSDLDDLPLEAWARHHKLRKLSCANSRCNPRRLKGIYTTSLEELTLRSYGGTCHYAGLLASNYSEEFSLTHPRLKTLVANASVSRMVAYAHGAGRVNGGVENLAGWDVQTIDRNYIFPKLQEYRIEFVGDPEFGAIYDPRWSQYASRFAYDVMGPVHPFAPGGFFTREMTLTLQFGKDHEIFIDDEFRRVMIEAFQEQCHEDVNVRLIIK